MCCYDIKDPAGQFFEKKELRDFNFLDDLLGQDLVINRFTQIIAGDRLGSIVIQRDINDHILLNLPLPIMSADDRAQAQIGYSYLGHLKTSLVTMSLCHSRRAIFDVGRDSGRGFSRASERVTFNLVTGDLASW